ncbi:MAG TPA: hypothetical protein VM325_10520 [Alphaproteobacteria bacterium]|nr:hypothetical protein [Alphaproteobacteria bacterium]
MTRIPIHPGAVDWTGENPGIYLKETEDGPWTGLMCFFRIMVSPHGRGHGVVLLDQPNVAKGLPEVENFCISDNEPLARYLVDGYFAKFASFKVSPGLGAMTYLPLTGVSRSGETSPGSSYVETVASADYEVVSTWNDLGEAFAVELPKANTATGRHEMFSLFIEAPDASVTVNGRPLTGKVFPRDFNGRTSSCAFLAFSESWVLAV